MSNHDHQQRIRLQVQPRPITVELLFRMFGSVLIPVEEARDRFMPYMNSETFKGVPGSPRLPIPVTTLEDGNRALRFFEIHHLAAHIEHRAGLADAELERVLREHTETT
ncbi:pyocin activator PrtN family protein [Metapseudomonas otitidis]|jgi:hypothetical protein|uniref:pyocin activator PrtN family protein n=1 Tax=Metapseudomonas otitidis TaxID=319939 RepID=UPI001F3EB58D|nr:pyocin activator PrtN family protein [Pseudomonas otitidis]